MKYHWPTLIVPKETFHSMPSLHYLDYLKHVNSQLPLKAFGQLDFIYTKRKLSFGCNNQ
jgi:hypothetical protein